MDPRTNQTESADPIAPSSFGSSPAREGGLSDPRLKLAGGAVALVGGLFSLLAFAWRGTGFALSVSLSATLVLLNLYVLARALGAILRVGATSSKLGWTFMAFIKTAALLAVVYIILTRKLVDPLALVIGLAALPVGLTLGSLLGDKAVPASVSSRSRR